MTLLELLVKELPRRGGWPGNAVRSWQSIVDGEIYFDSSNGKMAEHRNGNIYLPIVGNGLDEIITCEQYEAAIAAQQPVWNGEGLPPVGVLVELMDDSQSQAWFDVTIKYYGDSFAVWDDHGEECSNSLCHVKVRPIRTEAERKREDEIAEMASTPKPCGHAIYDICAQLYDAGYRKAGVTDDHLG